MASKPAIRTKRKPGNTATLTEFFRSRTQARELFRGLDRMIKAAAPASRRVTKSQIVYTRRRAFAWTWIPGRWLKGDLAPLVLSLALPQRDRSRRWKQVLQPYPGRWMHHLELRSAKDLDRQVRTWVFKAWNHAQ